MKKPHGNELWVKKCFFLTKSMLLTEYSSYQVAQNQVKVATDGSFCADTTFVQTPLKIFLFTLRLCSRHLKGTPELALYASKKLGPYGEPIGLY